MTFASSGGGHFGFCPYQSPGGSPNLYAMVFESLMPILNTIQNFKNLSQKGTIYINFSVSGYMVKRTLCGNTCMKLHRTNS